MWIAWRLAPTKFLCDQYNKPTTTVNPEKELWIKQDSLVLLWINATLTTQVLQRVSWPSICSECLAVIEETTSHPV